MIRYNAVGSGTGGGLESVTGFPVDITDPLNPVVKFGYNMFFLNLSQSGTGNVTVNTFKQLYRASPLAVPSFIRTGPGVYVASWGTWVASFLFDYSMVVSGPNRLQVTGGPGSTTSFQLFTWTDSTHTVAADDVLFGTTILIYSLNEYTL